MPLAFKSRTAPAWKAGGTDGTAMALRISGQSGSDHALRGLQDANQRLHEASQKLSSGRRLTHAGVDPAGLSIAKRLAAEQASFDTLQRGIQDGVSLVQTAESALGGVQDQVSRIKELATQAANGTLSDGDRAAIQQEIDQIVAEIDRSAQQTEFNDQRLLNGDIGAGSGVNVATGTDGTGHTVEVEDSGAAALGLAGLDVTSGAGAQAAISAADTATETVSSRRSALGADQNRLVASIRQVQVASENTAAARSRIEDADVAREATVQIAARIQRDQAIAVRAQLNQNQGSVLRLLAP